MVSKTKLYAKLDALEAELHDRLVPHLQLAAEGGNDFIFCVSAFNPFREFKNKTDRHTEALVDIGAEILRLREKLGEPLEGNAAERICWYCRQWAKVSSRKSYSSVDLATQFLAEIKENQR